MVSVGKFGAPKDQERRGLSFLIFVAIIGFSVARGVATFYTNFLWFGSIKLTSVWWTIVLARLSLVVGTSLIAFLFIFVNLRLAVRAAPVLDIFDSLVNESNGYSGLSLFNLSNIAIKEGDKVLALEYLARAAKDKNLSKKINDFAILKSGYIMLDYAEIANIEDKLSSLLNSQGPFSFYAKEIIALAYYRDNRYQESSKKFNDIANDASSPRNIASRSKIFSEQISSYDNVK